MDRLHQRSRAWSPQTRNAERARQRKLNYFCQLENSPFVVVFLTLLIISMLLPGRIDDRQTLNLPKSTHSAAMPASSRDDALKIQISASGDFYYQTEEIAPADLPPMIREGLQNGAEKRIYLYADARARYSDVKQVLDQIRLAGISNVTFITQ